MHIWNDTRKKLFDGNFLGINTHNFVKKTQNLKIIACFMQNYMELDMKKLLDLKTVTFGAWDLKTINLEL